MKIKSVVKVFRVFSLIPFINDVVSCIVSIDGCDVRIFQRKKKRAVPSGIPLVVIHGMTMKGYDDHRLFRFCSLCAKAGYRVICPDLPNLKKMTMSIRDVIHLNKIIMSVSLDENARVGIIGFSVGGTFALLSASYKEVTDKLTFVLCAGGYDGLESLYENSFAERKEHPYGILSMAYNYKDRLNLSLNEMDMFTEIMNDYCLKEKHFGDGEKELIHKIVKEFERTDIIRLYRDDYEMQEDLNISDRIKNINTKIFLYHSDGDKIIPSVQTLEIFRKCRIYGKDVTCLVSDVRGHLEFGRYDFPDLISFAGSILEASGI
jgi:pimeloyl-ACP methyl ester carboxylesterase